MKHIEDISSLSQICASCLEAFNLWQWAVVSSASASGTSVLHRAAEPVAVGDGRVGASARGRKIEGEASVLIGWVVKKRSPPVLGL